MGKSRRDAAITGDHRPSYNTVCSRGGIPRTWPSPSCTPSGPVLPGGSTPTATSGSPGPPCRNTRIGRHRPAFAGAAIRPQGRPSALRAHAHAKTLRCLLIAAVFFVFVPVISDVSRTISAKPRGPARHQCLAGPLDDASVSLRLEAAQRRLAVQLQLELVLDLLGL